MLVLSRRVGEELVIGNNVRIRVDSVRGNRVHLAIAAPLEVSVHRCKISPTLSQLERTCVQHPHQPE